MLLYQSNVNAFQLSFDFLENDLLFYLPSKLLDFNCTFLESKVSCWPVSKSLVNKVMDAAFLLLLLFEALASRSSTRVEAPVEISVSLLREDRESSTDRVSCSGRR